MKIWKSFTKYKSLVCVPNKTDTAIVDKVVECQPKHNQTAQEIAFEKKVCQTIYNLNFVIIQEKFLLPFKHVHFTFIACNQTNCIA